MHPRRHGVHRRGDRWSALRRGRRAARGSPYMSARGRRVEVVALVEIGDEPDVGGLPSEHLAGERARSWAVDPDEVRQPGAARSPRRPRGSARPRRRSHAGLLTPPGGRAANVLRWKLGDWSSRGGAEAGLRTRVLSKCTSACGGFWSGIRLSPRTSTIAHPSVPLTHQNRTAGRGRRLHPESRE
jgi:hypothetical protein